MDQKIHVFIIDDDLSVCQFLKIKLEKTDKYLVSHADSKAKGIRLVKSEKPDILILDIDLIADDGGDVAQELAENPETKAIPRLFFSSLISPEEVSRLRGKIGKHTIVSKTSGWKELVRNIEAELSKKCF